MQRGQQARVGDEHAKVGTAELVGRERVEIGTEGGHVDGCVRRRVHTVNRDEGAGGAGTPGYGGDLGAGPDRIGRRRHGDEPGALPDQLVVLRGG
jgi:hypothetical protein